ADLDTLEAWLVDRYAYAERHPDFSLWFADARGALPTSMPVTDFADLVSGVLTRFGDGHTRVPGSSPGQDDLIRWIPPGEPFSTIMVEDGIYHLSIPMM